MLKTRLHGWQRIATSRARNHRYLFVLPSWWGTHRVRVIAPRTGKHAKRVGHVHTLRVRTAYSPSGSSRDRGLDVPKYRWNPCAPITFRVNSGGGYRGFRGDIRTAFAEIGRLTGMDFDFIGATRAVAFRDQNPADTDVLVSWATPDEAMGLRGRPAGLGSWQGRPGRGHLIASGQLALDRGEDVTRRQWRILIRHEIGHVLNLAHANGSEQIMAPSADRRAAPWKWGAGDLAMLSHQGASSGCPRG